MHISQERSALIQETMARVEQILVDPTSVEALNQAKHQLSLLAGRSDLFPETEFPWPTPQENNCMYCLYKGKNGQPALYIDLLLQGVKSKPHDHGDAWAIIIGITGQETHHLYQRTDGGKSPGHALLELTNSLSITAGESVSLLPGGIHAIEVVGDQSIMMLHCYASSFEDQTGRLEYNLEEQSCRYGIAETGVVIDMM